MKRLNEITPVFCENIPQDIEHGKIYISREYEVSAHLCACGCGNKTVLPCLENEDSFHWSLTEKDGQVSFRPSIGNWQLPCQAHYYITENKIVWC